MLTKERRAWSNLVSQHFETMHSVNGAILISFLSFSFRGSGDMLSLSSSHSSDDLDLPSRSLTVTLDCVSCHVTYVACGVQASCECRVRDRGSKMHCVECTFDDVKLLDDYTFCNKIKLKNVLPAHSTLTYCKHFHLEFSVPLCSS